jgi:hypothetical protein
MQSNSHLKEAPDDKIIWQRFLAGEVEAFDHLMTLHFRTLFHYGSKFSRDKGICKRQHSGSFSGFMGAPADVKPGYCRKTVYDGIPAPAYAPKFHVKTIII